MKYINRSLEKKIETELNDIMEVIEENKMIDVEDTKNKFWNMFILIV